MLHCHKLCLLQTVEFWQAETNDSINFKQMVLQSLCPTSPMTLGLDLKSYCSISSIWPASIEQGCSTQPWLEDIYINTLDLLIPALQFMGYIQFCPLWPELQQGQYITGSKHLPCALVAHYSKCMWIVLPRTILLYIKKLHVQCRKVSSCWKYQFNWCN